MNTTNELQAQVNEIAIDELLLRDLASVEVVLIGGGDIVGTGL